MAFAVAGDGLAVAEKGMMYWDRGLPGFGVKVTPRGRKVFLVMYRLGGAGSRLRKYTIGPYGRVTLPMARAQAQRIFAARLDGEIGRRVAHRERRAVRKGLQGRREPAIGEDGRVKTTGEFAELVQRQLEVATNALEHCPGRKRVVVQRFLCHPQMK